MRLTERTARRLRSKGLLAGTLLLKIRQADFTTFSRQRSLHPPTDSTSPLYRSALELFEVWQREHPGAAIRLLGVGGGDLAPAAQGDLFADSGNRDAGSLDRAADAIRDRFDSLRIGRARTFNDRGDQR